MHLTQIWLKNIRNLDELRLEPSPALNLVTGANGAGKSSLMEAIYLLSSGRSFRSRNERVLKSGATCLTVSAALADEGQTCRLGLERCRDQFRLRIDGENSQRLSELARRLPVLVIHPESYLLLAGGPRERRRYLDWGLFHVEPEFHRVWQRFQRNLRQRNASLKSQPSLATVWDAGLAEDGEALDGMRRRLVAALQETLTRLAPQMLDTGELSLDYQPGWPREQGLLEALANNLQRDRRYGKTGQGPQRADLRLKWQGKDVQEFVSRGQQKVLVAVLMLAMAGLLEEKTGQRGLILVDDLASELDQTHRARFLQTLQQTGSQVFISSIFPDDLDLSAWSDQHHIHLQAGQLAELV